MAGAAAGGGAASRYSSAGDSVRCSLTYVRETGKRQAHYRGARPAGATDAAPAYATVTVGVRDARVKHGGVGFASHGFELVDHPTALSSADFKEREELVRTVYYREISDLIKSVTGASEVRCFHHMLRDARLKPGASAGDKVQGTAPLVHCDYTVHTATKLFNSMAKKEHRKGRFAVINAWRNITEHPILNHHLAMCDARSVVAPDSFVTFDNVKPGGEVNQSYVLDPALAQFHEWYYFPAMRRNEVILFMQYDSDIWSRARYTFHTAIEDPTARDNPLAAAHPRESIEVRCLAFFPDHEPNTIPVADSEVQVASAVDNVLHSLTHAAKWGRSGYTWLANLIRTHGGVEKAIRIMVDEGRKRGTHGLDAMSVAQCQKVKDGLLARRVEFSEIALRYFTVDGVPRDDGASKAADAEAAASAFDAKATSASGGSSGGGGGGGADDDMELAAVTQIMAAVRTADLWPADARLWMRRTLYEPGGSETVLQVLIADASDKGEYGLGGSTEEQRATVIAILSSNDFESVAKSSFPPVM